MMADQMRLAFVHDWLTVPGGSERALEVMLGLYPQAALYAPVFDRRNFEDSPIAERGVQTSFIDRLPLSKTHHRWFMPLMPLAVEQFDLRGYDVVISGSHAVAHGVLTRPDQLHVNYVYSPMRYAWHMYHAGLTDARIGKGLKTWLARPLLHYLRLWDLAAAGRVDTFIASRFGRIYLLQPRNARIFTSPYRASCRISGSISLSKRLASLAIRWWWSAMGRNIPR
jgi:hypothetical protein